MSTSRVTLGADGYLARDGQRWVPVGVNYWPGSCGVEMWPLWPAAEMQHDLDVVAGLGLNTVRFFLRWQDFEPEAGLYDARMFARLAQFLEWCAARGLAAHPSLFVGWMSGKTFWPAWRQGRNVFADPYMRYHAAAFAERAMQVIARYAPHVVAIDLGNELCDVADSPAAPVDDVILWCETVSGAVKRVDPQALVVSGCEQAQILADTGWRLGQQPGTDFYSMHGYPVPAWHAIPFDGMTDPLCQSLLPFYTRVARAFGPVMLQEFGTIVTFGQAQQASYLDAILPACWDAGANGFLWWCLRDITARVQPYLKNSFEGTLGLVDAQDRVKPGLQGYLDFAQTLAQRAAPVADVLASDVGLYWPKHYYPRGDDGNPGNDPRALARRLVMAHYLLRRLGHRVRVVRGDQPLDPALHTLVIAGALLGGDEAAALEPWVRAGHRLVWHGPDPVNWGPDYIRLLGARPVDYRATQPASVSLFGQSWTLAAYPHNMRAEVTPDGATLAAQDARGLPVVLTHRVGAGQVVYSIPFVEDAVAAVADDRVARDRWLAWYRGMLDLAG